MAALPCADQANQPRRRQATTGRLTPCLVIILCLYMPVSTGMVINHDHIIENSRIHDTPVLELIDSDGVRRTEAWVRGWRTKGADWVSQRGKGGARRAEDTSGGTRSAPSAAKGFAARRSNQATESGRRGAQCSGIKGEPAGRRTAAELGAPSA